MIKVLIVDPDPEVRYHLAAALLTEPDVAVIDAVPTATLAYRAADPELANGQVPTVVLIGTSLPDVSWSDATFEFRRRAPGTAVIVAAPDMTEHLVEVAAVKGAAAVCPVSISGADLRALVRRCAEGDYPIVSQARERSVAHHTEPGKSSTEMPTSDQTMRSLRELTERELGIVRLMGMGRTNAEIAAELSLPIDIVGEHIRSILHQLYATNRTQIARRLARFFGDEPPTAGMPARLPPSRPSSGGHHASLPPPDPQSLE